jgi:hypothetical protein
MRFILFLSLVLLALSQIAHGAGVNATKRKLAKMDALYNQEKKVLDGQCAKALRAAVGELEAKKQDNLDDYAEKMDHLRDQRQRISTPEEFAQNKDDYFQMKSDYESNITNIQAEYTSNIGNIKSNCANQLIQLRKKYGQT